MIIGSILPTDGLPALGSSLHNILSRIKAQPRPYPRLDLTYSASDPISHPVNLTLPANGLRLRFDGQDQRLRLIEVLDFSKASPTYKNNEVARKPKSSGETLGELESSTGPFFRHVYNRLFGPTYAGEYVPPDPNTGAAYGTYVLSYPGVAFSFLLKHSAWSETADFVSLLSSSAASAATSMAIFNGQSWPDARESLYTRPLPFPRSIALAGRNKEFVPDEIEHIRIYGAGKLEFTRRSDPPFIIILGQTSPQDLVAEFGPPDAIYRNSDTRITIHGHATTKNPPAIRPAPSPMNRARSRDSNHSSAPSYSADSDGDSPAPGMDERPIVNPECFYNYFHHGFDALVSFRSSSSPVFPGSELQHDPPPPTRSDSELVVTKILLHGNIPGSYPFNRHRRSRWSIEIPSAHSPEPVGALTSETSFGTISAALQDLWAGPSTTPEEAAMQKGMVLNRGWGQSPGSSVELLGSLDDASMLNDGKDMADDGVHGPGNTQLFGFPGLLFEVLKNGSVSCLTVY